MARGGPADRHPVQGIDVRLHNWGEFDGFSFETPDSLSFSFRYWRPDGDPSEGTVIRLRFRAVRRLVVTQALDFEPRVVGDLEHWLWQASDEGQGRMQFCFGDLVLEFRAEAVEIDGELPWETSD